MPRRPEHFPRGPFFHYSSGVHHRDTLGHLRHNSEIVRDEKKPHPQFVSKPRKQLQHFFLHRHVERRRRFIRD